jgi:hypothetical protein
MRNGSDDNSFNPKIDIKDLPLLMLSIGLVLDCKCWLVGIFFVTEHEKVSKTDLDMVILAIFL